MALWFIRLSIFYMASMQKKKCELRQGLELMVQYKKKSFHSKSGRMIEKDSNQYNKYAVKYNR